jgi:predicted enzyme related to lactoylglutathione lyase
VFPYEGEGTGGALICGPSANAPSAGGVVVYLDCSPSLDAALQRVNAAGGAIAMPRQALPPGMGFIAWIRDLDGNTVGLHALA